jgi:hypothetical protein
MGKIMKRHGKNGTVHAVAKGKLTREQMEKMMDEASDEDEGETLDDLLKSSVRKKKKTVIN